MGIVHPETMNNYYASRVRHTGRTFPVIVGTNGTLHPESAKHLRALGRPHEADDLRHLRHGLPAPQGGDAQDRLATFLNAEAKDLADGRPACSNPDREKRPA